MPERFRRRSPGWAIAALLSTLLLSSPGGFADTASPPAEAQSVSPNEPALDDARALEREYARRLSRARAEHEARRARALHKLEAERTRQQELERARAAVSTLGRRESFLHHDAYWTQRELDSLSRDPGDLSSMARRLQLSRELGEARNELDRVSAGRGSAERRLDDLRLR